LTSSAARSVCWRVVISLQRPLSRWRSSQSFAKFQSRDTGLGGDIQNLGDLRRVEPAEKFQLHDLALAWVRLREGLQRVVQSEEIGGALRLKVLRLLEVDLLELAAALERVMRSRVLDQNLPHEARGDAAEVRPAFPAHLRLVHELQVSFVHQRRRLQRVVRPFASEVAAREAPQLGVNDRHEPLGRGLVAIAPRPAGPASRCWRGEDWMARRCFLPEARS
jgi:hypothetical protein